VSLNGRPDTVRGYRGWGIAGLWWGRRGEAQLYGECLGGRLHRHGKLSDRPLQNVIQERLDQRFQPVEYGTETYFFDPLPCRAGYLLNSFAELFDPFSEEILELRIEAYGRRILLKK